MTHPSSLESYRWPKRTPCNIYIDYYFDLFQAWRGHVLLQGQAGSFLLHVVVFEIIFGAFGPDLWVSPLGYARWVCMVFQL